MAGKEPHITGNGVAMEIIQIARNKNSEVQAIETSNSAFIDKTNHALRGSCLLLCFTPGYRLPKNNVLKVFAKKLIALGALT